MAKLAIVQRSYTKADGTSAVYIRFTLDRKHHYFATGVDWPQDFFDVTHLCLPRSKKDTAAADNNLLIRQLLSRANEILILWRLADREPTWEGFKREMAFEGKRDSFIDYMERRVMERWSRRQIKDGTKKDHFKTINKLKDFMPDLAFSMFTPRTAELFDSYLRKKGLTDLNTRWGHHRNFKTYLNEAARDGYGFIHPYNYYRLQSKKGNWKALDKDEFGRLLDYYFKIRTEGTRKQALRRFIFACLTGLRISDLKKLQPAWIVDSMINYIPEKRIGGAEKKVMVPLSELARVLLDEAIAYSKAKRPFEKPSEQYSNRILSEMAVTLKIERLHHHIGRETFATMFVENGGSLDALKQYMGHSTLKVTERYLHTSKQRLVEQAKYLDWYKQ